VLDVGSAWGGDERPPGPSSSTGITGNGNFNTARPFTRVRRRLGTAGVCLEDKVLPKTNSFVEDAHVAGSGIDSEARSKPAGRRSAIAVMIHRPDGGSHRRRRSGEAGSSVPRIPRGRRREAIFINSQTDTISEGSQSSPDEWRGQVPLSSP